MVGKLAQFKNLGYFRSHKVVYFIGYFIGYFAAFSANSLLETVAR